MHVSKLYKGTVSSWTWPIGEKMGPACEFENLPLLLNKCGLEWSLPACLAEHRLGFTPFFFSHSRMSLTCRMRFRGPGQGQGVETSRRRVLKCIEFYLPPLSQGGGGGGGKPGWYPGAGEHATAQIPLPRTQATLHSLPFAFINTFK